MLLHPRQALFDAEEVLPNLPVCDHYAGVEVRMRKALALQAEMGPVFDVTLDCEDGAAMGGELEHAHLVADLLASAQNRHRRAGARIHPVGHPAFGDDASTLIGRAGAHLAYLMLPKPNCAADVATACAEIDRLTQAAGLQTPIPIHVLIETFGALREVDAIAAQPRVQSLSFGLMDFVSAHRGAIPASAMTATGHIESIEHAAARNAARNAAYDIELTTDSYRFGFLTPKSFKNTVIAGSYPNIKIKDCGENNSITGGIKVNTTTDPCN